MDIHVPKYTTKKKVAVFANGHNTDNLYGFLKGLLDASVPNSVDYFLFMTQSLYSTSDVENKSLNTIFDLPDLSSFDAAILYTPGLNFPDLIEKMVVRLTNSGIPVISVGLEYKGFYSVTVDNYVGMKDLCNHLIDDHNITDILFVAGSKDNSDSNARLQALKDAMAEHNLPFGEDNILYTNWEVGMLLHHIYNMIDSGAKFPQAFVCANDLLAETITYAMEDRNYPNFEKQVITGFDYMEETRAFYPSLASVDQQPIEQGKRSANILTKLFNNENVPDRNTISCRFYPGESCGCNNTREENKLRQQIARSTPRRFMENALIDGLFTSVAREMIHCENFSIMKSHLQDLFYAGDGREGDTFYIMLDHYLAQTPYSKDFSIYPKYQYSDCMDVIVAKDHSKGVPVKSIPTKDLLPGYIGTGSNNLYIFTPLYYESYVCGYIVFTNKLEWIKSAKFIDLVGVLKNAFITHRRNMELNFLNIQLSTLMEKDSLTSVKNRTAYDKYVNEIEKKISDNSCKPFSVICFDINNLKEINDKYGHEKGDEYIKNCCKFICNSFKKSPVFRTGGDEFVSILFDEDYNNREDLLTSMRKEMNALSNTDIIASPAERVSIATGMADYDPGSSDSYIEVFKWADEKMYQHKFIMKNGHIR